jgi:phosphatidylglycerol---prolipoprotein diacylglyceryl transferase
VRPTYDIGGFQLQSYGLHFMLSCLVLLLGVAILLRLRGQNPGPAIDLTLLLILGQVILAKALFSLLSKEEEFISLPGSRKSVSGFWGVELGFGFLAGLYLLWSRAPFRPLADALAVAWPFSMTLHKIGCFMVGCCHGSPTGVPWAVTFPAESRCPLAGQPIHPTQLYDAGLALLTGAFLLWAWRGKRWEGRLLLLWGFLYAVLKYATEWTRGDERFKLSGPVTAAMAVEIATAAICAMLLTKPGAWNVLLTLRELRSAAVRVPELTVRRGVAFALTLGNAIGAVLAAMVTAGVTRNQTAALAAIPAYSIVVSLIAPWNPLLRAFGLRLVTSAGESPSLPRLLIRGLVASVTMSSFFGLFRPLLDRWGRGLGDAASGTWLVRRVP